ncbi:hypothetical protein Q428_10875 [Fervidicella metallireducens AeB]|uniref:Lysine transporter LysE n=1 Tax=Fervidicella metallireducens AeB TaxID=1403537 RepID=A0A017RTU9_9CLOT|nr:LysE family transporter [Fervidicella metallireducens]EYE87879.1 hypothetical protein Q428_10875 [Fervidicella metallireducens AeB]
MAIIIKGIIIGMIVSFPIGPLGIISIQRSINCGWKTGFFSGIGAAASDIVYSAAAVFGISFIDELIHRHRCLINNVTGVLFLVVGINIFTNVIEVKLRKDDKMELIYPAFSNFLLGLSNPITFLVFITVFAKLGIKVEPHEIGRNSLFVISIFSGSTVFWFMASNLINRFKHKFRIEFLYTINKSIGVIIALLGIISIIKGTFRI